jgi:hypothetical protein
MANVVRMPASRGTTLDPRRLRRSVPNCWRRRSSHLDKQIERAEELLGADRVQLFLRAIDAHVADKLHASVAAVLANR